VALGAERESDRVSDPLGRPMDAVFGAAGIFAMALPPRRSVLKLRRRRTLVPHGQ
jgi:hypothetical protein